MASRRPFGRGQFAKEVAGHQQHIDFFGRAISGHALDGAAKVVGAILTAETVAEVPVGGVQDAHAVDSQAPASPVSCQSLSHKAGRCRKVGSDQLEYPVS